MDCGKLVDLQDVSDEAYCSNWTCVAPMVRCPGADKCIQPSMICDGTNDCPSGSDELCTASCAREIADVTKTTSLLTRCRSDQDKCILVEWLCDGKSDCHSGMDEVGCSCADWGTIECRGLDDLDHCVPQAWIDQGHPACHSGRD